MAKNRSRYKSLQKRLTQTAGTLPSRLTEGTTKVLGRKLDQFNAPQSLPHLWSK